MVERVGDQQAVALRLELAGPADRAAVQALGGKRKADIGLKPVALPKKVAAGILEKGG